jgi:hypothetical protein
MLPARGDAWARRDRGLRAVAGVMPMPCPERTAPMPANLVPHRKALPRISVRCATTAARSGRSVLPGPRDDVRFPRHRGPRSRRTPRRVMLFAAASAQRGVSPQLVHRVFPALGRRYRVVAPDHRGHRPRHFGPKASFTLEEPQPTTSSHSRTRWASGRFLAVGYSAWADRFALSVWRRHPERDPPGSGSLCANELTGSASRRGEQRGCSPPFTAL